MNPLFDSFISRVYPMFLIFHFHFWLCQFWVFLFSSFLFDFTTWLTVSLKCMLLFDLLFENPQIAVQRSSLYLQLAVCRQISTHHSQGAWSARIKLLRTVKCGLTPQHAGKARWCHHEVTLWCQKHKCIWGCLWGRYASFESSTLLS